MQVKPYSHTAKRFATFVTIFFALSTLCCWAGKKGITLKISDFISPTLTHSQSIGKCVRIAENYAKKTIIFDVPLLKIDSVILLSSNTTILLKHCTIQQNDQVFDNVFRGVNVPLSTGAFDEIPEDIAPLQNIRILGDGKSAILGCERHRMYNHPLEGWQEMKGDYYGARTHLLNFSFVDGIEVAHINFAKTNGWCICFDFCSHIKAHDLDFQTSVKNGDGIDFRCGCKYFDVKNITGRTSDDIVACTALGETTYQPDNKYLFTSSFSRKMWARLKAKDPDALHIEHGRIKNVISTGTHEKGWGHAVICLSAYGSQVRHIDILNIREGEGGVEREALVKLYTGYGKGYTPGDLNHIRVRKVEANTAHIAVKCNTECADMEVQDVKQRDPAKLAVSLKYPKGFKVK